MSLADGEKLMHIVRDMKQFFPYIFRSVSIRLSLDARCVSAHTACKSKIGKDNRLEAEHRQHDKERGRAKGVGEHKKYVPHAPEDITWNIGPQDADEGNGQNLSEYAGTNETKQRKKYYRNIDVT